MVLVCCVFKINFFYEKVLKSIKKKKKRIDIIVINCKRFSYMMYKMNVKDILWYVNCVY